MIWIGMRKQNQEAESTGKLFKSSEVKHFDYEYTLSLKTR